ncbi:hypothetical protein M9H77_07772 [Catharanthus roseus]|uniref:Uncharacterized protein n=1 Tax=Catharanthus roseus TaxID=4058 RepID=A0ACC0BVV7_CATRO|nr:hypothetical protein M9H77_07772 [Catharanthus roseus]
MTLNQDRPPPKFNFPITCIAVERKIVHSIFSLHFSRPRPMKPNHIPLHPNYPISPQCSITTSIELIPLFSQSLDSPSPPLLAATLPLFRPYSFANFLKKHSLAQSLFAKQELQIFGEDVS